MVRIPEHNDWVTYIILGCIALYIVMLRVLQRDATLVDFALADVSDGSNILPSWIAVSVAHVLLLSCLVSQFVPSVPKSLEAISILGIGINKFGFTFCALAVLYLLRSVLSWFFYALIGQLKTFTSHYFLSTKFYFFIGIIEAIAAFALYYLPIDRQVFFNILILSIPLLLVAKVAFYAFHRIKVLPEEWYYKILYICTLQFAPVLALWQLLFF